MKIFLLPSLLNKIIGSLGRWVGGLVVGGRLVGGSVVGGFNKTPDQTGTEDGMFQGVATYIT